ncbi:MAG: DUF4374 domain-containing protein [Prevotella sp.]|nr:DUF4374 domain-containing protein [Prevotella sp.]
MDKKHFKMALLALAAGSVLASCSDDDNTSSGTSSTTDPSEVSFIITSGDPTTDLTGGVYMKIFNDLTTEKTNQTVYGDLTDGVRSYDSFTQVTYNNQTGCFTGYIYARGASDQGIGSMKAGLRTYSISDGKLQEVGSPVLVSAFGNTGTFGTYSYAAQISQPYAMVVDANGTGNNIAVDLPQYAIDEVNPNISNIVDMGDGQVAMVLNYSNRDSAAVAFCDYNLNIKKIIYDGRIGVSVGAQRSVRYTQSSSDDDGNIYIFSGSSTDDAKVGALRIKKGTTEFDTSYQFDILSASGGYRFRKAFHISDDKFLLEFYNSKTAYGNMDASGKMAIVDMSDKSLVWVTGLPDPTSVSIGWGDGYEGSYYLPIAAGTSFSGSDTTADTIVPTIFRINAQTGVAESFMTFGSGDLLKAITIIKK